MQIKFWTHTAINPVNNCLQCVVCIAHLHIYLLLYFIEYYPFSRYNYQPQKLVPIAFHPNTNPMLNNKPCSLNRQLPLFICLPKSPILQSPPLLQIHIPITFRMMCKSSMLIVSSKLLRPKATSVYSVYICGMSAMYIYEYVRIMVRK